MIAAEYIKLKNLINICKLCGVPTTNNDGALDMWISRSLMLVSAMCDLGYLNKYPASSSLADLITFVHNNPDAKELATYIEYLPGYDRKMGVNQNNSTLSQHGFIEMGLIGIFERKRFEYSKKCTLNLNADYLYREDLTGSYLDVEYEDFSIKLERRNEFKQNQFRINGKLIDDLAFHNVVNIITYSKFVNNITKENIEAIYYFLA
jgi:hypothetical protein